MDRHTFSQSWSRVNRLTPTLRPQVVVRRRIFRGHPWYVLHEPLSNQFSRLNPVAYHFVALLDGRRTVEEAWELTLARYGDDAPTQNEVITLLGQLNQLNLLRSNETTDAHPLLARHTRQQVRRWTGQAMSILFLQLPLFNPHHLLNVVGPFVRPLLSRVGLVLWLAWLTFCAVVFFPHLPEFLRQSTDLLATPANWGWTILIFAVAKVLHEMGHGLMCQRFGGPVYEAGVMLLLLFPCPYVDATSAWSFESKWQRLLVSAAGMMFEVTFAGAAALAWVYTDDEFVRQIAHHLLLATSIATVLFNANPLMRFDGYFMLSDALEIPNLYERANQQLRWICQRFLFGLRNVYPPSTDRRERILLVLYGIGAMIYRVLVMVGIVLIVSTWAFTVGLALALWTIVMWVGIPLFKFLHWLATSGTLHRKRGRAIAVTASLALVALAVVGLWPAPDHRRAIGVIEAADRAELIVRTAGFVRSVHAQTGQWLNEGDLILSVENPMMAAHRRELEAQLRGLVIARRQALLEDPGKAAALAERIEAMREELALLDEQMAMLDIRAPISGQLVAGPLQVLEGQYLSVGDSVGQVIEPNSLRVTALVDQAHNSLTLLNDLERVELRIAGMASRVMESQVIRAFDSGRLQLPHPALSTLAGGPIAMDPDDREGRTTLRPHFHLWLKLPTDRSTLDDAMLLPGQRVYVRFTLAQRRPLAVQWLDRIMKVFDPRMAL